MSRKDLQPKQAVISRINASANIDTLSAAFMSAFGDSFAEQSHMAIALKKKLINTDDDLEKYQVWREIEALHNELLQYNDNRVEKLASDTNVDLDSFLKAYIMPGTLPSQQLESWKERGKTLIDSSIDSGKLQQLSAIDKEINALLRSDPSVSEKLERLESEFITPLATEARKVIDKIKTNGKSDSLLSEFHVISEAIESAHKVHIDPVLMSLSSEISENSQTKLRVLQEQKRSIGLTLMSDAYDSILEQSSVSTEDAEMWAKAQEVAPSAISRMQKSGYTEAALRRDMATYYRLLNGRLDKVRIVTTGSQRASAIINTATIDIDNNFDSRTLFHEMSHLLEIDESVKLTNQHFIQKRASGSPQSLRALTNNSAYKSDEIAVPDSFFSPYVGKIYQSGATEVSAMGIQQFSSIENMYALFDSDREMFTMKVGMMSGVDETLINRQKGQLEKLVKGADFAKKVKSVISKLSWQDGHRLASDEAWESALLRRDKWGAQVRKWHWKKILGNCELFPAKAPKIRKQYYGVKVTTEKEQSTHFFRDRLQAEIFIYLHELSARNIKHLYQDAFYLACNDIAPSWYQPGANLPII